MNTVVIEVKSKSDSQFWLELARKTGTKAKAVSTETIENAHLASMIEKGLRTNR